MRILNRLGGIELSKAYATIKAISKKKSDVIAEGRKDFVTGATAKGLDPSQAGKIFALIEFFGGYGFNKSHTTAYALVAYQTAYLKAHYPTDFMAALLSSEMDGAEREKYFVEHIEDCRRMGLEVLAPDINAGEATFKEAEEGKIHFGLGAIKGVGLKAIDAIVEARKTGIPFSGLDDLFERVPMGTVNQACVEALIKAGAFDSLGARRSQWLAVLPRAAQAGQTAQEDRKRGQKNLFDMFGAHDASPSANGNGNGNGKANGSARASSVSSLPDIPELLDVEKLAEEKKVLGFYMSSHPLTRHSSVLGALATHKVSELGLVGDKTEVILGGMITGVQLKSVSKSRSGLTRMAKLTFEDLTGSTPAMLWPEEFAKFEPILKNDTIGFVRGTLDRRRDPAELIVSRIIPLADAPGELSRGVVVTLRKGEIEEPGDLERLLRMLRRRPGNLDVYLELMGLSGVRRAIYRVGPALKIRYDDTLISDLESTVRAGNVRLVGHKGATTRIESAAPVLAPARIELDFSEEAYDSDG